jgi:23S rRNA (pseudouridine1915-N3)-methyltransferase
MHLIAVGKRMPAWVDAAVAGYAGRLPHECSLVLREIAPAPRTKGADISRGIEAEGERLLAAVPDRATVIALDVAGVQWSTASLAAQLGNWLQSGRDIALLIGGPDGLSDACLHRADMRWSLSPLTFPHPLVRVILAEQLYRAWSLHVGHPYHRE